MSVISVSAPTAREFWASCTSSLQQELPPQQFSTWIRPLHLEVESEADLRLLAPNAFILKWVRERYLRRIEALAEDFFGAPARISLGQMVAEIAGEALARPPAARPPETAAAPMRRAAEKPGAAAARDVPPQVVSPAQGRKAAEKPAIAADVKLPDSKTYDKTHLRADLTFENLVVGKANDLARAAAQQVAQNPGASYNPLFIYGGTGLGKTHMIHAMGNFITREFPGKIVRYVHAEDYYTAVVAAYRNKSFDTFKRYYRSLDVLLLDDVQFFNGKDRSQEEFFFAFNALLEAKKQIVITSDTYPKNINGLDDRLVTRFDWGLTVQIEPPETEMRVAILKKKAESERLNLDDEVAFFIAKHLRSNVRELEGALKKVLAYSTFRQAPVTLEITKEALRDIIGSVRNITIEGIQKTVADYYKIKVADLFSRKRTRVIARPRQIAMWLCKEVTQFSYPMIGEAFGGRDHTTVIHAVRTIEALKSKETSLAHDLHVLTQVVKG
ncbi:MAG: chromosomal replication initiator protein DnaA [Zoogloeaceae bacterium]|jgi:chromosomal replication initiator protein|nr:chromosomal replication initiator protein DnaA [Zoogloeaceae bacterium]